MTPLILALLIATVVVNGLLGITWKSSGWLNILIKFYLIASALLAAAELWEHYH